MDELKVNDRVRMLGVSPWGGPAGALGRITDVRWSWTALVLWDGGQLSTWEATRKLRRISG